MKKIVLLIVCAGLVSTAFSQESGKKVQVGLAYQFGLNFNKPGTKIIERDGVGVQNAVGVNINFAFNENIGLSTGLEFDFESFKYRVTAVDPIYYRYEDVNILHKEDDQSKGKLYNLQSRKEKAIYGTIPTMLLFRTNMIGDFRYYGKFGARSSFLLGNTTFDEGFVFAGDSITGAQLTQSNDDLKATKNLAIFRSAIGLVGGAEWNFTGNTSLFAEIGFYYGFTEIHNQKAVGGDKERNLTLFQDVNNDGTPEYLPFSAKQKQLTLKIGILF